MLKFETAHGPIVTTLKRLVVAGWTGRDATAVQHHIEELAAIGVPRPSEVPLFYAVDPALATQADEIRVLGKATSGEAEPLLLKAQGRLWLGLGSDHTDRWLEATSVAHSKQACPKVLSRALWAFDEVSEKLDALKLATEIDGGTPYQDGTLAQILPLTNLLDTAHLEDGDAMLCGTLPAIGGVRAAQSYKMALADDSGAELTLSYNVRSLPVIR